MKELPVALPKLLVTAGLPGGPGGIHVVDFDAQEVYGPGAEPDNAEDLRGVGVFAGELYAAAEDELRVYGPDLRLRRSHRCTYLRDAQSLCILNNHLYVISRACDSILAFDLERQVFFWGLQLAADGEDTAGAAYDPAGINGPGGANGPPARCALGLEGLFADARGLFVCGAHTGGLWHVGKGNAVTRVIDIPGEVRDARPFRDGVLFNDADAGALRFVSRAGGGALLPAPGREDGDHSEDPGQRGKPRGLCAIDDRFVAAGSAPATLSVYDLDAATHVVRVAFSTDLRHAIHSIAAWPR